MLLEFINKILVYQDMNNAIIFWRANPSHNYAYGPTAIGGSGRACLMPDERDTEYLFIEFCYGDKGIISKLNPIVT